MLSSTASFNALFLKIGSMFSLRRLVQWIPFSGQAPRILLTQKAWHCITSEYQRSSPVEEGFGDGYDGYSDDMDDLFTSTASSFSELDSEGDCLKYVGERKDLPCNCCRSAILRDGDTLQNSRKQPLHNYVSESDESYSSGWSDRYPAATANSLKQGLLRRSRRHPTNHKNIDFSRQREKVLSPYFWSRSQIKRVRNPRKNRPACDKDASHATSLSGSATHSTNSRDRIRTLEKELAALRGQLAQLIIAQEGKQACFSHDYDGDTDPPTTSTPDHRRLEADGESDVGFEAPATQSFKQKIPAPMLSLATAQSCPGQSSDPPTRPIPPPPPILISKPVPRAIDTDWRTRLIEAKRRKAGGTASNSPPVKSTEPADMQQVLKQLKAGGFKLRSIPRSPGGTPVCQKRSVKTLAMDPGAIISRALKNKLRRFRATIDSSCSGDLSGKSSLTHSSAGDELRAVAVPNTIYSPPTNSVCTVTAQSPAFGQHLLRPTGRGTVC